MFPFWPNIIEPMLTAIAPSGIVEIGSEHAHNTDLLLRFCTKHGTKLHVVDPAPRFDVRAYAEKYGETFHFHKDLSLNALPTIKDNIEVALIDGDHNWYTVYNELRAFEVRSRLREQPFPVVFLHDIGWPYGRRDLYYDPATIPEEHRQPYARKGMWPGKSALLETGGMNASYCHALEENTPRNGVRTAVEDFLTDSGMKLDFLCIPGYSGLGILVRRELRQAKSQFAEFIANWDLPPYVSAYLQQLENHRLHYLLRKS